MMKRRFNYDKIKFLKFEDKKNIELQFNKVWKYFKDHPYQVFYKEELMELTGLGEREVRHEIKRLRLFVTIISSSDRKGYYSLPFDLETIEDCDTADLQATVFINETLSRINELNRLLRAPISYKNFIKSKRKEIYENSFKLERKIINGDYCE